MSSHERIIVVGDVPQVFEFSPQVPMSDVCAPQYERAYGFQSEDMRRAYQDTHFVFAGAGGGGQLLSVYSAHEGALSLNVADPDHIAPSNGRLTFNGEDYWGVNKALVAAEEITKANDSSVVRAFTEGITEENVEEFILTGSKKEQRIVVVDEIDVKRPDVARMLARKVRQLSQEREQDIFVTTVMDINKGGIVTTYHPRSRYTFERVNGISDKLTDEELVERGIAINRIPYLPKRGSLQTLLSVQQGSEMPTEEEAVLVATGLGLDEIHRIVAYTHGLPHYPKPTFAPRSRWLDADGPVSGSTRFPRASHYRHLVRAVARDTLGLNASVDYSPADIERRERYRQEYAANRSQE